MKTKLHKSQGITMKKITAFLLTSACALTSINTSFGMENADNQTINQKPDKDLAQLLTENNKLLRGIKRQNRVIIKQNYLNFQHQTLHTELCASPSKGLLPYEEKKLNEKYTLQTKIKETYCTEKTNDNSWNSSDEEGLKSF